MTPVQSGLRLILALMTLPLTLAACVFLLVAPGPWATALSIVASLIGLLAAEAIGGNHSGRRGAQIILIFGALLAAFLLAALPMPPQSASEVMSSAVLVAVILTLSGAAVFAVRRSRIALALAAGPAIYGAFMLLRALRLTDTMPQTMESPAYTLSRGLAILLASSCLVGAWSLRPRRAPWRETAAGR